MQSEHEHNRVEFEDRTLCNEAKRDVLMGPALGDPVGHERDDCQCSGDGSAFEVFRLSGLILGQNGHSHVKPSQTGQTAENKECEEQVIERCTDTKRESCSGGSEAEGDL